MPLDLRTLKSPSTSKPTQNIELELDPWQNQELPKQSLQNHYTGKVGESSLEPVFTNKEIESENSSQICHIVDTGLNDIPFLIDSETDTRIEPDIERESTSCKTSKCNKTISTKIKATKEPKKVYNFGEYLVPAVKHSRSIDIENHQLKVVPPEAEIGEKVFSENEVRSTIEMEFENMNLTKEPKKVYNFGEYIVPAVNHSRSSDTTIENQKFKVVFSDNENRSANEMELKHDNMNNKSSCEKILIDKIPKRRVRCKTCEACLSGDCKQCVYCQGIAVVCSIL